MRSDSRPRLGPRPLPVHLMTAAMTYASSGIALPLLKNGSLDWKIPARKTERLGEDWAQADCESLTAAVDREGRARLDRFLSGVEAYRRHSYRRDLADPPVFWAEGSTRVLHFAAAAGPSAPSVLVVPSLINRSYVLDLSSRSSFMRWLAARGYNGYLVDWGMPGDRERAYTLTDYVAGRLERLFAALSGRTQRKLAGVGYCMGGNLALSLALRRQSEVAGLALLATPWDFHAAGEDSARAIAGLAASFEPYLTALGVLSTDVIQFLFCTLDPLLGYRKFRQFAELLPGSSRALEFVALEDWLNDGVPLVAGVARECLVGWYGRNEPAQGHWRVAGGVVDPAEFMKPTIAMIPQLDRIVPPQSARALADAIPRCEVVLPKAGHIGMMAGRKAEAMVWRPLQAWLDKVAELP